jgi:hypothetical protein
MQRVVVEKQFEQPITYDQYARIVRDEGKWCFEQYRVAYHATYLSADGRRTVCIFDAPDAEALRMVGRALGTAEGFAWSAEFHVPSTVVPSHGGTACAASPGFETVVVERQFSNPVTIADLEAIPERANWCLEAHRVRHLGSYVARHGRRMLCIYEAPDAEAARLAQSKRNMPFESAWRAKLYP